MFLLSTCVYVSRHDGMICTFDYTRLPLECTVAVCGKQCPDMSHVDITSGTAQQALLFIVGLPGSQRLHEGAVQSSALPSGQPGFLAAAVSGCSGLVSEPIRSTSPCFDLMH